MITIIGGELLSSLGSRRQRIAALASGRACPGEITVNGLGGRIRLPYYRLDENRRLARADQVAAYLNKVTRSLFNRLFPDKSPPTHMGVFLGSSSIDYSLVEPLEDVVDGLDPGACPRRRVGGGFYVDRLMDHFGLRGPALTINTACTSSINGLMEAAAMLACRTIDHALVLGLELSFPVMIEGFAMMQLLSPDRLRPFADNRNGMVLGEAVSAVLLSRDDVMESGWHFLGGESCCETHSIIGAEPGGRGMARVIRRSMQHAGITPDVVTAVKSHGIGGELMDSAEFFGMARAFDHIPPYFSLKPYIGHTLGGCGVAELVLLLDCVEHGFLPATPDAEPLDAQFSSAPLARSMELGHGRFMLNYFGFGGNNSSCIIEKVTP